VTTQLGFDADLDLAMNRRSFLKSLGKAAAVAATLATPLGCGRIGGRVERRRQGDEAPVFDPVQRQVIAKIIDGFNPPDTPLRQRLQEEDPDYDLVQAWADFAYANGDAFVAQMRTLVDFLNILPTFNPAFFSRRGLPVLRLRAMHVDDVNRYMLHLRDSGVRAMRNIFTGAKYIGTAPLYMNETVAWKDMRYPGPWLLDPKHPKEDLGRSTSYDLAQQTQANVGLLRNRIITPDEVPGSLEAATVVGGGERLILETDVVVVGSGAGGSFVAAEVAQHTDQRVLILENGEFFEPEQFLQRERFAMPRMFYTQFSVTSVPGTKREIPTVSTATVTGRLVGGSATINHALAFEPPKPVIQEWNERYGAEFDYADLQPHLDAVRAELRVAAVPASQISGSNLALKRGALALGMPHHGASERNAHQCIGCGFCDLGCRYNRKITPLNMVLPRAGRHGAQLIANCLVQDLTFEDLPEGGPRGQSKRVTGVRGVLRDGRGTELQPIEIRARRVVLAAGPFGSPRILLRSNLDRVRRRTGKDAAIGGRFSTHGTITFYGDFDDAIFPSAAGPPMAYFVKTYETDDQATADPERHHIRYALEGMLNHPIAHAQLMPYESAESYQTFMRRFNQTMTLAVMFRDRAVGRVTRNAFEYALAEEDHANWLDSIRTGARLMFASGAKQVFFNTHRPLILNSPDEIDATLTLQMVKDRRIQLTSGHPMGGCALGGDPKRDVVDSRGRSWDVEGLYVADSSTFPTSLGINPCVTTYALGRFMGERLVQEIRSQA
jgi:choline dehydrogenase-like flavoprotein